MSLDDASALRVGRRHGVIAFRAFRVGGQEVSPLPSDRRHAAEQHVPSLLGGPQPGMAAVT